MNADRIKLQHAEEQVWQGIREHRADLERIVANGPNWEDGDEYIIVAVLNYVIAKMGITDIDLEDEDA